MKLITNILTLFFGMIVALILGEFLCRILIPYNDTNPIDMIAHPKLPYLMKPDSKAVSLYGVEIRTNSFGFRGKESPSIRGKTVIVLGDSTTFGYGVKEEDTFSARLESQFNSCTSPLNSEIYFVNTGHSGFNLKNYYDMLEEYGQIFKPEFVLIGVMGNDFTVEQLTYTINDGVGVTRGSIWDKYQIPSTFVRGLRKSALYITVGNFIKSQPFRDKATFKNDISDLESEKIINSTEKILNDFVSYSEKYDIPLLFVYLPMRSEFEYNSHVHGEFIRLLKAVSEVGNNVYFLDLLDEMSDFSKKTELIFSKQDSVHPNSLGHQIIAEKTKTKIQKYFNPC
jgi:lysophospholipase L1-like esterase